MQNLETLCSKCLFLLPNLTVFVLTFQGNPYILELIRLIILMITRERISPDISEFLRYLAAHEEAEGGLPTLNELSLGLGISVASLREQLEVARALGLVEVKPGR